MDYGTQSFESAVENAWPPSEWRNVHVVAAVSGGADSVALLRVLWAIMRRVGGTGQLFVAHLDHGLRGSESAADAAWVGELCQRLDVPLEVERINLAASAKTGAGFESAARVARYDFLCRVAERRGARFVATGHTADDQVETVVHHVIRGTGLAGLRGMPRTRPLSPTVALVRPLLGLWRRGAIEYLEELGQEYRDDVTNNDPQFTRNRLRHELLPLVRAKFNADADAAIIRLAQQADEAQHVVSRLAEQLAERSVDVAPAEFSTAAAATVRIDCPQLAGEPALLSAEVARIAWTRAGWPMQEMGYDQWQQLAAMITAPGGQPTMFPGGIRAHRDGDSLVLQPMPAAR